VGVPHNCPDELTVEFDVNLVCVDGAWVLTIEVEGTTSAVELTNVQTDPFSADVSIDDFLCCTGITASIDE
jgi:hypothetical protein